MLLLSLSTWKALQALNRQVKSCFLFQSCNCATYAQAQKQKSRLEVDIKTRGTWMRTVCSLPPTAIVALTSPKRSVSSNCTMFQFWLVYVFSTCRCIIPAIPLVAVLLALPKIWRLRARSSFESSTLSLIFQPIAILVLNARCVFDRWHVFKLLASGGSVMTASLRRLGAVMTRAILGWVNDLEAISSLLWAMSSISPISTVLDFAKSQ